MADDDFDLAADLAQEAGALAARMLADGVSSEQKTSITDVVTAADHAAERLIAQRLRTARPDDGLVGEEGATAPSRTATGRTWYIDPVDGTYNFLSGLPAWCVALALGGAGADERPLLGCVFHHSAGELWLGGADRPTTCNGTPVAPLADRPFAEVSLATYLHPTTLSDDSVAGPMLRVMGGAATVRMLGSGSIELAAVAAGRLGASVQTDSLPWDWLPGAALVRAAGGVADVLEIDGRRWHVAGSRQTVADISTLLHA